MPVNSSMKVKKKIRLICHLRDSNNKLYKLYETKINLNSFISIKSLNCD